MIGRRTFIKSILVATYAGIRPASQLLALDKSSSDHVLDTTLQESNFQMQFFGYFSCDQPSTLGQVTLPFLNRGYLPCCLVESNFTYNKNWVSFLALCRMNNVEKLRQLVNKEVGAQLTVISEVRSEFVNIPEATLIRHKLIDEKLCLLGTGDFMEIWSKRSYEKAEEEAMLNFLSENPNFSLNG